MASSVEKSRFKIFPVKSQKCTIKTLVELNHLPFKKGRGFYQLNKPELIQEYKEVIIRRKEDGAIITGDKVREMLKIPKSSKKFKIDLTEISDFDVFIQSTSVNRVLLPGTDFLYEADESTTDTAVEPKVVSARGSKRKAVSGPTETTPKKKVKVAATTVVRETRVSKRSSAKAKPVEEEKEPTTSVKRKTVSKSLSAKAKPVGKKESAALPLKRKSATDSEAAEDIEDGAVLPKKAKLTATPSDGPVEIVFSFDTTGSMYPCLTQVRRKVSDTVKRLTREIPGIRIAVIAHGDYCDSYTYVTKILDFTQDEAKICSFVENVESTAIENYYQVIYAIPYQVSNTQILISCNLENFRPLKMFILERKYENI